MAKKYLASNKIKVFPSSFRGKDTQTDKQYNPSSFLTLEENYVNINKNITYMIQDYCFKDSSNSVHIILHGYHFSALLSDIINLVGNDAWVGISLGALSMTSYDNEQTNVLIKDGGSSGELLDVNDEFKALVFGSSSGDVSGCDASLQVLSGGVVYTPSTLNVSTNQIKDGDNAEAISESFTTNTISAGDIYASNISASSIFTTSVNASSLLICADQTTIVGDVVTSGSFNLGGSSSHWQNVYGTSVYADETIASVFTLSPNGSVYAQMYVSSPTDVHLNVSSTASLDVFTGGFSVYARDAILLSATNGITLNGTIYPSGNNKGIFGSSTNRFSKMYIKDISASNVHTSHVYASQVTADAGVFSSVNFLNETFNPSSAFMKVSQVNSSVISVNILSGLSLNTYADTINMFANSNLTLSGTTINLSGTIVNLSASASKTKLTKDSVGNASTPIYLNNGTPTTCSLPDIKAGDVFMGHDSQLLADSTNVGMTAFLSSGTGDIESSSNTWQSLNNMSDGSIGMNYVLVDNVLKISMRLKNWKALVGDISGPGRGLRFKWDWLVAQTLGSNYSARVNGEAPWHNSIVASIDTSQYNSGSNSTGSVTTHIGYTTDDTIKYVYIWQDESTSSSVTILGVNAEITMLVRKNS